MSENYLCLEGINLLSKYQYLLIYQKIKANIQTHQFKQSYYISNIITLINLHKRINNTYSNSQKQQDNLKKMSLQPVVSSMLIDFQDSSVSPDQKAYQKQVYSAIKLNMNDLQKYDVIDKFTQCVRCKQVLTDKDKGYVYDFEEVDSNPSQFGKQNVEQLRKAKFTKVLWKCSFCFLNNIVNTVDLRFAKNKSRVIQRQKCMEKKDPIILIVFDLSGSMDQLIEDSSGNGNSWQHLQKIKQTKIYKKIVADEQKQLQDLIKAQFPGSSLPKDSKFEYVDHLKKNKLLMGLTEYLINKMSLGKKGSNQQSTKKINDFCRSGDSSSNKNSDNKNKTIGFMFFNSNVMLHFDSQKTSKILLVDQHEQYKPKLDGFEREIVDFDSFETLFKTGQKFGDKFTNKISTFDFESIDLKSMSNYTQGQTALGPAIVTALGVISKHGQGSSIVVVTDGIGNKGIFDQTQPWDQGYKLLKMRLQKMRCFMTVLQFRRPEKSKMKQDQNLTGLDKFCQRYNDSIVKKINVLLNENEKSSNSYGSSNIQQLQKKLRVGIDRDNCKFTNQVFIKSQHPIISYEKSKNDLQNKLFNLRQVVHIVPQYIEKKLTNKDYLHHFMTQIVIKYEDTKTGQQSIFMSYITQKFIKYTKMKPKDLKSLDNQSTFMNIIEYLHNQQQQLNLENLPLGIIRETFRKTLCRTVVAQKTFRFPNQEFIRDQTSYQWMQNIRKFQDQTQVAQYNKMQQQNNVYKKRPQQESLKAVSEQNYKLSGNPNKSQQKSIFGSKTQNPLPEIKKEQIKIETPLNILKQQQEYYNSQDQYISL